MANIRSAEKDIRKTAVRTAHNQTVKNRIRTLRKKVLAAVEKKDAAAAAASAVLALVALLARFALLAFAAGTAAANRHESTATRYPFLIGWTS